ncbi:hypothetical protein ACWCXH_19790, partial [Kitasatospora sp. NPDC001660]
MIDPPPKTSGARHRGRPPEGVAGPGAGRLRCCGPAPTRAGTPRKTADAEVPDVFEGIGSALQTGK